MNSENTIAIKKVLEQACGGTAGPGDQGWQAEGVERLFFDEYGAEGFKGGCAEIRHGENNSESVRLELELAPALAARVIALCTNTTLGEMPDLTEPEQVAIEECVQPWVKQPITVEIVDGESLAQADRRNKEIADLILAQRKERDMEKEDAEEKKTAEVIEELDFDLPEAPLT